MTRADVVELITFSFHLQTFPHLSWSQWQTCWSERNRRLASVCKTWRLLLLIRQKKRKGRETFFFFFGFCFFVSFFLLLLFLLRRFNDGGRSFAPPAGPMENYTCRIWWRTLLKPYNLPLLKELSNNSLLHYTLFNNGCIYYKVLISCQRKIKTCFTDVKLF